MAFKLTRFIPASPVTSPLNMVQKEKVTATDEIEKKVKTFKKPTVKAAPKDNSRKAIKARKTADKKAGVSKSQMRANKAKSKSEAFMAKAKASKDPSMRAQLKRKSDRLAKRAARKGGSPAKAVTDPKDPKDLKTKKVIKKTKVITPSNKKKVKTNVDRFANFRGDPRYTPVAVRPDGTVTMMDKDGHTFGMGKPYKK